jgi:hypothetical protein
MEERFVALLEKIANAPPALIVGTIMPSFPN